MLMTVGHVRQRPDRRGPGARHGDLVGAVRLSQRVCHLKPAGGLGCAANYDADEPNSTDVIYTYSAGTTVSANSTFPDPGNFTLCAYVQEGSGDATPEAVSSARFLVGPDPCVTARAALSAATKAVHVASVTQACGPS
jgi:hypothetical protein